MALTPLNIDRSKIAINDTIIQGFSSASINLQNELFIAQNTSQKTFYKNLSKKSNANISFSKVASTYDFLNTIKDDYFTDENLSSLKIISEVYGNNHYGVKCSDVLIDDVNISVSPNEYVSMSYNCVCDNTEPLSGSNFSISNPPTNYTEQQATEVTGYLFNFMTDSMVTMTSSNSDLELTSSLSLGISSKKKLISGIIASSKKIWANSTTYTLNLSINDITKNLTQDPSSIANESFVLKFYYDEDKVNEMATLTLNNCALTNYSEGLSEISTAEQKLTYTFVDSSLSGAFVFQPEVTLDAL